MQEVSQGGRGMICPRCGRPMVGWLVVRPDRCSPKYWVNCIRNPK